MSRAVAALLVHYRTYDDLERCLASLRRHEPDIDIIVVDYESSPDAVARIAAVWPDVRVVPLAGNQGFAAGVNQAARHAPTAVRLLLLNPDAVLDGPIVAGLEGVLASNPRVAVVGPLVRDADGAIQASARRFPGMSTVIGGRSTWLTRVLPGNPMSARNLLTGPHVREPIVVDWVSGACMLIRRDAFVAVGGFDERFFMYWEDADLCRRLRAAGWLTMYHPGVAIRHAAGSASRRVRGLTERAFHRSVFHYYLKHGGWMAKLGAPAVWTALRLRLVLKLLRARQ